MWTDTAEVDMTLIKLTYHFYQHENLDKAFIAQLNSSCPITVAYLVCLSMPLFKIMVLFIYVCMYFYICKYNLLSPYSVSVCNSPYSVSQSIQCVSQVTTCYWIINDVLPTQHYLITQSSLSRVEGLGFPLSLLACLLVLFLLDFCLHIHVGKTLLLQLLIFVGV